MSKMNHASAGISLHFESPDVVPEERLVRIEQLIMDHGAVGRAFIHENLRNAYLIGYAMDPAGNVVGTAVLKRQKESYRKQIETLTGVDLTGHLERGYTSVHPSWRGLGVAWELIRGLIERARDQRVYITVDLENGHALQLARKSEMVLAGTFFNERTERNIGVFVNRSESLQKQESSAKRRHR